MSLAVGDTVTVYNREATVDLIMGSTIRCRYNDTNQIVDVPKAKLVTPNACQTNDCLAGPDVRVTINAPGNYNVRALCEHCAERHSGTYVTKEPIEQEVA